MATVPALLDSTVGILLLRRKPVSEASGLIREARAEIGRGTAFLPAVTVTELLLGERKPKRIQVLSELLARIPTVPLTEEAAHIAGTMGAFLRTRAAPVPFSTLVTAATAVWLDLPLLTWDPDFHRAGQIARQEPSNHPGSEPWQKLRLHPESRVAGTL